MIRAWVKHQPAGLLVVFGVVLYDMSGSGRGAEAIDKGVIFPQSHMNNPWHSVAYFLSNRG